MTAKRILVIDDEEGIRDLITLSLEAHADWEILTAASGLEGIAVAAAEHPDAIVLDMAMPDMDGRATLEQLQLNRATQNIPTILLTASSHLIPQQVLSDSQVIGVITKPFEVIHLADQIRELLHW